MQLVLGNIKRAHIRILGRTHYSRRLCLPPTTTSRVSRMGWGPGDANGAGQSFSVILGYDLRIKGENYMDKEKHGK